MARHSRKRKLSKKELKAKSKVDEAAELKATEEASRVKAREVVPVALGETVTVAELAKRSGRSAAEIVGALLQNGVIATVNDSVDRTTIEIIADELEISVNAEEAVAAAHVDELDEAEQAPRPPVVTIMGHVAHGKTTLLDAIRQTNVAGGESGGITQHIGAYQVEVRPDAAKPSKAHRPAKTPRPPSAKRLRGGAQAQADSPTPGRRITFIDTPGHEAFSALRAHGATITDIAILVVAADDGVKPQTKEALSHARAADVPVIVALTKVDKPEAQLDRVKGELAELGLNPEDWGGKTPVVPVSAKTGQGLSDLLETVLLVADLAGLTARPVGPAQGVVIESHMEPGAGPLATVLIQQGQLSLGDALVAGEVYGRVRFMEDDARRRLEVAGPSTPIRIAGLSGPALFGTHLVAVASEKVARETARHASGGRAPRAASGSEEGGQRQLSLIVKGDVGGSLKAITTSVEGIEVEGVAVTVIHDGVGDLTESDVHLAIASAHPLLLAFRTNVTAAAKNLAKLHGIEIRTFAVIYELLDHVKEVAQAMRERRAVEVELGRLKVLKVFLKKKDRVVVGGRIESGVMRRGSQARIQRDGTPIGEAPLVTVQQGPTEVGEVGQGEECGLALATDLEILEGDVIIDTVQELQ
ncbi:translation initiation factor IF-2 [Candidatus Berkelbacteria bacterium]|nr:translation initiation factor IF-2 [Candidatus Berkelbacteria bacterium]